MRAVHDAGGTNLFISNTFTICTKSQITAHKLNIVLSTGKAFQLLDLISKVASKVLQQSLQLHK